MVKNSQPATTFNDNTLRTESKAHRWQEVGGSATQAGCSPGPSQRLLTIGESRHQGIAAAPLLPPAPVISPQPNSWLSRNQPVKFSRWATPPSTLCSTQVQPRNPKSCSRLDSSGLLAPPSTDSSKASAISVLQRRLRRAGRVRVRAARAGRGNGRLPGHARQPLWAQLFGDAGPPRSQAFWCHCCIVSCSYPPTTEGGPPHLSVATVVGYQTWVSRVSSHVHSGAYSPAHMVSMGMNCYGAGGGCTGQGAPPKQTMR